MVGALILAGVLIQEEILRNGGFEAVRDGMPAEWSAVTVPEHSKTIEFLHEAKERKKGERCARIRNTMPANRTVNSWTQKIDGEDLRALRGRRANLSGWVRTDQATVVDMWIECLDAGEQPLALLRTHAYGAIWGTTEWKRYIVSGVVPERTKTAFVRCVVRGMGDAWFDELSLRAGEVPRPVDPVEPRAEHVRFREAASKWVLSGDRDAIGKFAEWTPAQVEAALWGGLGPPPWRSGWRKVASYEIWIPEEAKTSARPLLVADAPREWVEAGARDVFVMKGDWDAVRDACARFPVDADRVYVASWAMGAARPERAAGVAAIADRPAGIVRGPAWWIAHGDADRASPVAAVRAAVEEMRKQGIEHVYREHVEAGPEAAIDRGNALEWLAARKRASPGAWVDGGTASVSENVVTVTCKGPAARVWLSPAQADFAKPVKVVVNGRVAHEGAVRASFESFLERLRATGDARAVCWGAIDVKVVE